jgi:hypothetical protein
MKEQVTNLGQAISILVQAAEFAQTKGVFSLKDVAIVAESISFIEELNQQNQTPAQEEAKA